MTPGRDPYHRTGVRPGSRDQGPSQASLDAFIDLATYMNDEVPVVLETCPDLAEVEFEKATCI